MDSIVIHTISDNGIKERLLTPQGMLGCVCHEAVEEAMCKIVLSQVFIDVLIRPSPLLSRTA